MTIPVKDGQLTETINEFFRGLLEKKVVEALVLPQAVLSGQSYAHTLVTDPGQIQHAAPFLPVLMVNGAKVLSSLTAWDPGKTIGAVLRTCEIRALIELAKLKQANLERIVLIGVDCLGTMEASEFATMVEGGKELEIEEYLGTFIDGHSTRVRKACQVCPYPVPTNVAVNIGFIGVDAKKEIYVRASAEIAEKLGLSGDSEPAGRNEAVTRISEEKKKKKEAFLAELKERFKSVPDMLNEFARCKRCYNCRQECPICYCKECIFLTKIFEHKPDQYLKWAQRKGAIKMPYETLLFHLTRLNHMVFSCVECGLCTSACPSNLPVYDLFQYVGKDVQALFDYVPGMKPDEAPPILTFRENELEVK